MSPEPPVLQRFVRRTREGVQRPPVFEASDGYEYVLKLDEHDPDFPIAEVVAASLAPSLSVPVPSFERLGCPDPLLDALRATGDGELGSFAASFERLGGICFGSRYLPPPVQKWRTSLRSLVADCDDVLLRVFLFDAFVENLDRTSEHNPNLLVSEGALYAIDHGQALPAIKGLPSWPFPYASHIAWPLVERAPAAVLPHLDRLRGLPDADIAAAVAAVPPPWWRGTPARADHVRGSLIARRAALADTLEKLMRQSG
ncbi:MAG: HipA family kinase [Myxococcota bacterium]